jgi:hypothetical protein
VLATNRRVELVLFAVNGYVEIHCCGVYLHDAGISAVRVIVVYRDGASVVPVRVVRPARQPLPPPLDFKGFGVHDKYQVGLANGDEQVSRPELWVILFQLLGQGLNVVGVPVSRRVIFNPVPIVVLKNTENIDKGIGLHDVE